MTVGEQVTALGDGNGTEEYLSAATGSVTATDQPVTTQAEGTASGESLTGMIEISSDVVPGYSGGATVDADGEVVGMTTAATSNTDDPDGYAIPISKVLDVAGDLTQGVQDADYDYGQPAFLGDRARFGHHRRGGVRRHPGRRRRHRPGRPDHLGRRHRRGHGDPAALRRSPPTPPATTSASPGPTRAAAATPRR